MLAWAARGAAAAGRGRGHPWPGGRPLPAPGGGRRRLGVVAGAAEALAQVRALRERAGGPNGAGTGSERDAEASRMWTPDVHDPARPPGLAKSNPKRILGGPFWWSRAVGREEARRGSVRGLGPAGSRPDTQRLTPFLLAVRFPKRNRDPSRADGQAQAAAGAPWWLALAGAAAGVRAALLPVALRQARAGGVLVPLWARCQGVAAKIEAEWDADRRGPLRQTRFDLAVSPETLGVGRGR